MASFMMCHLTACHNFSPAVVPSIDSNDASSLVTPKFKSMGRITISSWAVSLISLLLSRAKENPTQSVNSPLT